MKFKVGITGGIGSGKTLVCRIFESLGVKVYYSDDEAKRIMIEDRRVREKLGNLLGKNAYTGSELNRSYISSVIFSDGDLLGKMNAIVHPAVQIDFQKWTASVTDSPYVIKESALLFESGTDTFLDSTILVFASEDVRIMRVIERDGVNEEVVRERMRNQMDDKEKRGLADHIIINEYDNLLIPQVIKLHEEFLNNLY